MNFRQTRLISFGMEENAGGIDYVPPASCPRSAYISARAPAYVEATGKAVPNNCERVRLGRRSGAGRAIFLWEAVA
jgi:hypothetical protein